MEVGVLIFATDYSIRTDELAIALEERGFDALFLPEHTHIPASRISPWPGGGDLPKDYWHTHDPFVALAYAAAVTKKLKLGTGICLLAQREAIVTAKSVASLDMMSNGRFIFGIGGGWNVEEMNDHGVEYKTRFAQMREQVLAMKALWTEEDAAFHGDFVNFDASWAYPKPVQKPHAPVILGGETDYTLRRVVDYCDGWLPRARNGFDAAANMARLKKFADEAGRDVSELSVSVFGAPADAGVLAGYAEAGINRALLTLPSAPRDEIMGLLDKYAPLTA
ncbi:MAG: LLM class F420-dependent oxidoreductase [Alphaproteobacteria bacterium]|nr:LLM class F420-dependent oxidoreductase [Alphaproteobacteria bacterium]